MAQMWAQGREITLKVVKRMFPNYDKILSLINNCGDLEEDIETFWEQNYLSLVADQIVHLRKKEGQGDSKVTGKRDITWFRKCKK